MWDRSRGSGLGLLLLASQLNQVGLGNIPNITLAVFAVNVYLYLFPIVPLMQACLSVEQAIWFKDWRRLLLSPLHHVDDLHLYLNMVSFIWKGIKLERMLGGGWFLYLLSVFSVLTELMYLVLEALLTELTQDQSYSMTCAVGFSGVLFALKVLINHYDPGGVTHLFGFSVTNRYACWAELVIIHIISPGASFIGHLAGILVGLLYTAGPLKTIMKKCEGFITSNGYKSQRRVYFRSSGSTGASGTGAEHSGYLDAPDHTTNHTASYTGGLTEEKQLETAISNSLNDRGQTSHGGAPPPDDFHVSEEARAEEIRFLRLKRFDSSTATKRRGARRMAKEKQLETDISNSLNDRGQTSHGGAPPPDDFHVSEEARAEEIRFLRLRRFDSSTATKRRGARRMAEKSLLKSHLNSTSIG